VLDTFVAAFAADPAVRFFFPDDDSYPGQAAAFAGHLFDRRVARGTVWIVDGGHAVSMWDRPVDADPDPAADARVRGLAGDASDRLAAYEAAVHTALPTTPHWYLGVLATHPDHAGRRWGRAVMSAGLAEAAAAGLPSYLETTNPGNVDLYRRAGWDVVETVTVRALTIWIMSYVQA